LPISPVSEGREPLLPYAFASQIGCTAYIVVTPQLPHSNAACACVHMSVFCTQEGRKNEHTLVLFFDVSHTYVSLSLMAKESLYSLSADILACL
jgi:hypothetical protein